jgi:hypothetical protein
MRSLGAWALWWLALFGLWVVMQGTNEKMELAAGAAAAVAGATFAELARRQRLFGIAPGVKAFAKVGRVVWRVFYEYAVITWALVLDLLRVKRVRSAWAAPPFPPAGRGAHAAGDRVVVLVYENVTPNTMAADIDCELDVALKHDLVPNRGTTALPS